MRMSDIIRYNDISVSCSFERRTYALLRSTTK